MTQATKTQKHANYPGNLLQGASLSRRAALKLASTGALALTGCNALTQRGATSGASTSVQGATPLSTERVTLYSFAHSIEEPKIDVSGASYEVSPTLDNVTIAESYSFGSEALATLGKQGFFVNSGWGDYEFYPIYEANRYAYRPNFVTVDSLMHTYHLYFQYLLKQLEQGMLTDTLASLTERMLKLSQDQLQALSGTAWESACVRNIGYFAIAASLLGLEASVPADSVDTVQAELTLVMDAAGQQQSPIMGIPVDYSQFSPRGYYTTSETLERYFRTMMWYGQLSFLAREEDLARSATLMTLTFDADVAQDWGSIYAVTSFFAGASDDNTYYEYHSAIEEVFGADTDITSISSDEARWQELWHTLQNLPAPLINSVPGTSATNEQEDTGFRFMGQRFSIDALVFQHLMYDYVGENAAGQRRLLPDALDIPAAFGSQTALSLLRDQGDADYAGYEESLEQLRESLATADETFWQANLYNQWLKTLLPLLDSKDKAYPFFMLTNAWERRNLELFCASYTELKHDTVLYSKQPAAEGDGDLPEQTDDRGYVQPEPIVFIRLSNLCAATSQGLQALGLIQDNQIDDLAILETLAANLATIATKELTDELPNDEEFELIRSIGVQLQHFWEQAKYEEIEIAGGYLSPMQEPAPVVVDVATGGDTCLELGTTFVEEMYVVVPVAGELRVASGPVFGFRQFEQPISERLTDDTWLDMLRSSWSESTEQTDRKPWTEDYHVNRY